MFNQVDHNLDVYWKYRTFPNYLSLNEKLFKKNPETKQNSKHTLDDK